MRSFLSSTIACTLFCLPMILWGTDQRDKQLVEEMKQKRQETKQYYLENLIQADSVGQIYLRLTKQVGSQGYQTDALEILGTIQNELGNHGGALTYFLEAHRIAESRNDSIHITMAYNNIATTYHAEGRLEEAINYYQKARPGFFHERLRPTMLATVYYNLAIGFLDLGRKDSAEYYFTEGISISEQVMDTAALADIYNALANFVSDEGRAHEATLHLQKALRFAREIQDDSRIFYPLLNLGTYAIEADDLAVARSYLTEAYKIAYSLESIDMQIDVEKAFADLESKADNSLQAFNHLSTWADLSSQRNRDLQKTNLALAQEEFDSEQKTIELATRQLIIKRQKESLTLQNQLTFVLVILIGVVGLVALALWRLSVVRRKHSATLLRMNEEKDNMLHAVAHDLQSPVVNIRGLSNILESDPNLDQESGQILKMISRELDKSDHLVRNLLDLESIESGDLKIAVEPVSITEMISLIGNKYSKLAKNKNITVETLVTQEDLVITTDPGFIQRIMDNLISNAIKFSPKGTQVRIELRKKLDQVIIQVIDQGPGLSSQDQSRLFGRFQRLSAQPTAGEPSAGLGLAITKALVDRLNGSIGVTSEPGEGASFSVSLPIG